LRAATSRIFRALSAQRGQAGVAFSRRTDCPPALREAAARLFDLERNGMLPTSAWANWSIS